MARDRFRPLRVRKKSRSQRLSAGLRLSRPIEKQCLSSGPLIHGERLGVLPLGVDGAVGLAHLGPRLYLVGFFVHGDSSLVPLGIICTSLQRQDDDLMGPRASP